MRVLEHYFVKNGISTSIAGLKPSQFDRPRDSDLGTSLSLALWGVYYSVTTLIEANKVSKKSQRIPCTWEVPSTCFRDSCAKTLATQNMTRKLKKLLRSATRPRRIVSRLSGATTSMHHRSQLSKRVSMSPTLTNLSDNFRLKTRA